MRAVRVQAHLEEFNGRCATEVRVILIQYQKSAPGWVPAFADMTGFGPDRLRYESRAVQNSIQGRVHELCCDLSVSGFARMDFVFPVA